MTRTREWVLTALIAVAAAATGYGFNAWRIGEGSGPRGSESAAALVGATLPDLQGVPQTLEQWRGKVVVVNFWATWCAPCREEIPLFVQLQERYRAQGLQFVGIAIDAREKVGPYAAELGMNFPVLIGGVEAIELTRKLGNRAGVLPFTVVLTRQGAIAATEVGIAKEEKLGALIQSLL